MTAVGSRRRDANGITAWADDEAWASKLAADRARANRNLTSAQRRIMEEVVTRARSTGAQAVALTGSTARARRTEISDLDFHVVGSRPPYDDLPAEVDIYAGDVEHFWKKLRSGDDFVQWTLRYACILSDAGVFRAGLRAIAEQGLWPDAQAKLARLPDHVKLAARLIAIGDADAAQAEVRAALTTAARGILLEAHVFPLARSELPGQLRALGHERLASALAATIDSERSLTELGFDLAAL